MTSEPKWTPGPWRTRISADFLQVATQPLGAPICDFGLAPADDWDRDEAEEVAANARLIAAAPELYEALERLTKAADRLMQNIHEFDKPTDQEFGDAVDSAIFSGTMALKKARGE